MKRRPIYSSAQIASMIREAVLILDVQGTTHVSLDDPLFDFIPCPKLQLYRVARRYCEQWGYRYQPVTYRSSRAHYRRPFEIVPEDQKAGFTKPALIKVKT